MVQISFAIGEFPVHDVVGLYGHHITFLVERIGFKVVKGQGFHLLIIDFKWSNKIASYYHDGGRNVLYMAVS